MQKITTFLWFDMQAEAAAEFYTSLFEDSKITEVARYPEGSPLPAGSVMTVAFRLAGLDYIALNGGPEFTFNEAISLSVNCDSQEEVDRLWTALTANGGKEGPCGWLKDKYGLSWQINPTRLGELLGDPDREKASRVMKAMLTMKKIDLAALEKAAAG